MEFTSQADRRLQALGQRLRERRDFRAFLDARGRIDVQADGEVERGDGHRFGALRGVKQSVAFRELDLDAQDLLLLQHSAFAQPLGDVQIVLGPANRVVGNFVQGPFAQYLIIGYRHLIGYRLVGSFALKLGNINTDAGLAVPTQPTAKVEE